MEPLRGTLKKAFALEIIAKNPFDHIELPTVRQDEVVHLRRIEMQALLEALPDTTHGRCCELILRTGLRKSEVAGLEWQDIDLDGQYSIMMAKASSGYALKNTCTATWMR